MPKETNCFVSRHFKAVGEMIYFKTNYAMNGFEEIHPKLREIALDLESFFEDAGEEMVITETKTSKNHDEKVGRKHAVHREGRAIDISTRLLDGIFLAELIRYTTIKYGSFGAVSKEDGKRRIMVYGDKDHLDHIHLQIAKGLK